MRKKFKKILLWSVIIETVLGIKLFSTDHFSLYGCFLLAAAVLTVFNYIIWKVHKVGSDIVFFGGSPLS